MRSIAQKTAAALTIVMAIAGGGAALAQTTQTPEQPAPVSARAAAADRVATVISVLVNGQAVVETGYVGAGGETMLPLRAVAEAMGFQLVWRAEDYSAELSKGSLFTMLKTGENSYTYNKMLKTLEAAPELADSKLYVPVSFFGEILGGSVATASDGISIAMKEEQKAVQTTGVVTAVRESEGHRSLQIKGFGMDGIVLNVGEQTEILAADGSRLNFSDLAIGMEVQVEHSLAMTMSLPPQTAAFKVQVISALAEKDVLGTSGVVEEVRQNDDGSLSIRIAGEGLTDRSPGDVVLRLVKDTVLLDADGNPIDANKLGKGARVVGFYSPLLTKSLPPIGTALKVTLVEEAPAE